jgi:hypothetical protein
VGLIGEEKNIFLSRELIADFLVISINVSVQPFCIPK